MRNLREHPITKEEIVDYLQHEITTEVASGRIGGNTAIILHGLQRIVIEKCSGGDVERYFGIEGP